MLTLESLSQARQSLYDPDEGGTKDLQSALKRLGFDPGAVDGIRGPASCDAERAAAAEWGLDGLDATSKEFRARLAREILLHSQISP